MARPGYNEDNSLNVAPTGTPVGRPNPHTSTGFSVNDNAGTGTTTGRPNPHTDTGFSGGQTLAGGGNNPGYQDNFFPPNNQGNDGNNDNNTGSGATGGENSIAGLGGGRSGGSGYGNYLGSQFAMDFLGKRKPATDGLIDDNLRDGNATADRLVINTQNAESGNLNTGVNRDLLKPTLQPQSKLDGWNTIGNSSNTLGSLTVDGGLDSGGNAGINWQKEVGPGTFGFNAGYSADQGGYGGFTYNIGSGNAAGGLIEKYAHGGPVGLMSLPHGYEDGGQVIPATSIDPTADDYFLKEFYKYMKRYLPGYDKEQDYYRQEKNRERMKREAPKEEEYPVYDPENPNHFMAPEDYKGYDPDSTPPSEKNPAYDPENPNHFMVPEGMDPELFKPGTPTLEAAEGGEVKPFGGTRERVLDQVEAFDNAPVHMEEPNVNMYGKSVPLTIARKAQKYMEGLDPVKRQLVQEMLNMFQMKKQQEMTQEGQQEEMLENNFFGPNPSYKNSMNI